MININDKYKLYGIIKWVLKEYLEIFRKIF